MPHQDQRQHGFGPAARQLARRIARTVAISAGIGTLAASLGATLGAAQADAATLTRSIDVAATPAAIWSLIGPFCAIKDWLPPVGSCAEDGGTPPTRTLVTKDGAATFIEIQTARSDARHFYSYAFKSSPLPVSNYNATIEVTAKGQDHATVTWRGSYEPDRGQEKTAADTLGQIYEAGLNTIKAQIEK
jgi:hypothetical protein